MKCFNHQAVDAVAVCVVCGRALCADCAKLTDNQCTTCSSPCQVRMEREELRNELLTQHYSAYARNYCGLAVVTYSLGAVVALAPVPLAIMIPEFMREVWSLGAALVLIGLGLVGLGHFVFRPITARYRDIAEKLKVKGP